MAPPGEGPISRTSRGLRAGAAKRESGGGATAQKERVGGVGDEAADGKLEVRRDGRGPGQRSQAPRKWPDCPSRPHPGGAGVVPLRDVQYLVPLVNAALVGRARWGWAEGEGPTRRLDLGPLAVRGVGIFFRNHLCVPLTFQQMSSFAALPRPEHVGILAMEAYFPSRFVTQVDLEAADGCKGKYTSGLGQDKLAFVDDR